MHAIVVLCLSAAFLGLCKAAVLPAEETDLELTAADTDSGNWTANLGDMEVNIEHKHGNNPVLNSSGSWTLDISRTTFQKRENYEGENSREKGTEIEIEKSSTGASENHNKEGDAEIQSVNNEIDNDIPIDEFRAKYDNLYFPQQQMPVYPQLPQQEIRLTHPFQPWLYGQPNYLYEMLPPREDSYISTPFYPQAEMRQNPDISLPKEESMISTPLYPKIELRQNSDILMPREKSMISAPIYPQAEQRQKTDMLIPKEESIISTVTYYPEEDKREDSEILISEDILTPLPNYEDELRQVSEFVTEEQQDQDQQTMYQYLFGWKHRNQESEEAIKVQESEDAIEDTDEVILDPEGFEYFKGVGWFKLDAREKDWEGARDACAAVGAHLAVPDTQERVKVFLKLFQRHPEIPAQAILREQVYIGVNDPERNRQFTTVQGKPFNPGFPIWFLNEPDNAHPGESCVTFHIEGRTRDVPCFYNLPFFCEKDIPVII